MHQGHALLSKAQRWFDRGINGNQNSPIADKGRGATGEGEVPRSIAETKMISLSFCYRGLV